MRTAPRLTMYTTNMYNMAGTKQISITAANIKEARKMAKEISDKLVVGSKSGTYPYVDDYYNIQVRNAKRYLEDNIYFIKED